MKLNFCMPFRQASSSILCEVTRVRSHSYTGVKECLVQVRELKAQKKTLTVLWK